VASTSTVEPPDRSSARRGGGAAKDARALVLLVVGLLGDPRVPRAAKGAVLTAGIAAVAAGALPMTIGRAVRAVRVPAVVLAVRRLIAAAGHDVVTDHWRGSADGLGVLVVATGMES
jgi:hypothetical protein